MNVFYFLDGKLLSPGCMGWTDFSNHFIYLSFSVLPTPKPELSRHVKERHRNRRRDTFMLFLLVYPNCKYDRKDTHTSDSQHKINIHHISVATSLWHLVK